VSEQKKNADELGALWPKTGSKGDYFTGNVNGQKVIVFRNDRWTPDGNAPQWRIYKSRPKGEAKPTNSDDIGW
jgi:hypothetical protein